MLGLNPGNTIPVIRYIGGTAAKTVVITDKRDGAKYTHICMKKPVPVLPRPHASGLWVKIFGVKIYYMSQQDNKAEQRNGSKKEHLLYVMARSRSRLNSH